MSLTSREKMFSSGTINPKVLAEAQRLTEHEANTPGWKNNAFWARCIGFSCNGSRRHFHTTLCLNCFDTPVFLFLMMILTSLDCSAVGAGYACFRPIENIARWTESRITGWYGYSCQQN